MKYVMGIDLGTSSLKLVLMDQAGSLIDETQVPLDLLTPQRSYCEQDPAQWQLALSEGLKTLLGRHADKLNQLVGMSLTGQMHSLVLLDGAGKALRPAILWNDVRTSQECQRLMAETPELLNITHNKALEGFTLPKILWVQTHEAEIWRQVRHILLPKDYLTYLLTGRYTMDYSDAAGTLLMDLTQREWSQGLAQQYQIDPAILPDLLPSGQLVGQLTKAWVRELGLAQAVPVFAGGADNACGALAAGVISDQEMMLSIGTSGVVLFNQDQVPQASLGLAHHFAHVLPETNYLMGVTLSAGLSLSWFRDSFAPESSFDDLMQLAAQQPAGAGGLLFTPYLAGERTPHADSKIRASFIGLDQRHQLGHLARAVVEGVTFSLYDCYQLMTREGAPDRRLISVGGGASSVVWLQIQADIFNQAVYVLKSAAGPSIGAAMIAAVGAGLYPDFSSCAAQFVQMELACQPDPVWVERYRQLYPLYRSIYAVTRELCYQLIDLD